MTNKTKLSVLTMAIGLFLCMLDTTVMNIALPAIQSGLQTPLNTLQWSLNIYTITFASLTIPLGRLAETYGRNKLFLIGLFTFLIGSLLSGSATGIEMLIVSRGIQSIGAAIVFPSSMTIAISLVNGSQRQTVILVLGLTQGLAAAFGPIIGGVLTQFTGWRSIFFFNIPLLIVAITLSLSLLQFKQETRKKEPLDLPGIALIILTLFSLTYALVQVGSLGWSSVQTLLLFSGSLVSLCLLIWREATTKEPIIDLELFKDRQFDGSVIASVISGIFFVALMVLMPSYFTQIQGVSELRAALIVTPTTMMVFLISPFGGFLIQKLNPRVLVGLGLGLICLAYVGLYFSDPTNFWLFTLCCILLGSGYGLIIGPASVLSAGDFVGKQLTASQSVMGVFRQIATALAVAIFVSSLSSNITTAKQNIFREAQVTLRKTHMTTRERATVLTKTRQAILNSQYSQSTNARLSTSTRKLMAAKTASQYIQTHHVGRKQKLVYAQIKQKTFNDLGQFNQQLENYQASLHRSTQKQLTHAFMTPFKMALPYTLCAILSIFIFKSKKRQKRRQTQ